MLHKIVLSKLFLRTMKLKLNLQGIVLLLIVVTCKSPDPRPTKPLQVLFSKSIGSNRDFCKKVATFADGSFVMVGKSESSSQMPGHGRFDGWVVKFDAQGNVLWQKVFGGSLDDELDAVVVLDDGGMLAVGGTESNDGDVTGNHGQQDIWLVRLGPAGNLLWQKTIGGTGYEVASGVVHLPDGSFVVSGHGNSSDGDFTTNHGTADFKLVKVDADGKLLWQHSLGGTQSEFAYSLATTPDGGFVLAGGTFSSDGDVTGSRSTQDMWIVRTDNAGTIVWSRTVGGSDEDFATAVVAGSDGTIAVTGEVFSSEITGKKKLDNDFLVIKMDASGTLLWQNSFGGSYGEIPHDMISGTNGSYLVLGSTTSSDGNVYGNHGGFDGWLIKVDGTTGSLAWQQALGGSHDEDLWGLAMTPDHDLVLVGSSDSTDGDLALNKTQTGGWVLKVH